MGVESMSTFMAINSGLVDVDSIYSDDLGFHDVANSLARINRFCGNFDSISVLQHVVLVAHLVEAMGGTLIEQIAALHHDDCEVIIGDIPSPIKQICPDIVAVEDKILDAVDSRWGCKTRAPIIREADKIVGAHELAHHIDRSPHIVQSECPMPSDYRRYKLKAKHLTRWPHSALMGAFHDFHQDVCERLVKEELAKPIAIPGKIDPCLS